MGSFQLKNSSLNRHTSRLRMCGQGKCGICLGTHDPKKLVYLLNTRCPDCSILPEMPLLKILHCWKCPELRKLANMPLLSELICWDCPKLVTLPELPSLTMLDCSNCKSLGMLPDLPALKELKISGQDKNDYCQIYSGPEAARMVNRVKKTLRQRWARLTAQRIIKSLSYREPTTISSPLEIG